MRGKTLTTLVGGFVGAAVFIGVHADAVAAPDKVTVLGGSARGSWYPIAVGMGKILSDAGTKGSARIGGGNANVVSVSTGQAEAGITFNFTAAMAANGEKPFDGKSQTCVQSAVYSTTSCISSLPRTVASRPFPT